MDEKSPRILHVIETLGQGGAEQLLTTALPKLQGHGFRSVVGVLRPPLTLSATLEQAGIPVIELTKFHKWNLLAGRKALADLVRREDIALVHAHLYFPSLYTALLGRKLGMPTAETFHNLAYGGANGKGLKISFKRELRSALLRKSGAAFYGVSAAVADHYSDALRLGRVKVLYNAIDMDRIEAVAASSPRPDERSGAFRIVVPGRLVREKAHEDLIEALSRLDSDRWEVVFVGGGPLEDDLRAKAASRGVPLEITGALDNRAMLEAVARADLVVIPSRHEGFGLTAAEAMALGVPVIATDAGGLPEVLGNAGVIVPKSDPAALAGAIGRLAANREERRRLGAAGAKRARSRFSADRMAAQLAEDYRTMLGGAKY